MTGFWLNKISKIDKPCKTSDKPQKPNDKLKKNRAVYWSKPFWRKTLIGKSEKSSGLLFWFA
jgi:hypothetical protein